MSTDPKTRHGGDPGPEGPEGEPVGSERGYASERGRPSERDREREPEGGMPMIPEHGAPDANPIDPRVF